MYCIMLKRNFFASAGVFQMSFSVLALRDNIQIVAGGVAQRERGE